MEIERDSNNSCIRIMSDDGGYFDSQTVEVNILYEILQELKRIKRLLQGKSKGRERKKNDK